MICGIPTLMDCPDVGQLTRFCAETGFSFAELNMTFPWCQADALDTGALRAAAQRYGVGYTLHLHDQVNPFEFSPDLREGSLNNVRHAIDLALALGMPRITMHLQPGTYSTINGVKTYLYDRCEARYLELVRVFRDTVDARLRGAGVLFCIENTSGFRPFHHRAIDLLLESDVFGLTFDIGHSFRAGGEDGRYMLEREDRIRHFHIHDCDVRANHLGLGEGQLDLVRYLRLAERLSASVVAEVKDAQALVRSKAYLTETGFACS